MLTEGEIGWMAGLFEGEGYIMFRGVNQCVLGINMTDLDIIERFQTLAECGSIKLMQKAYQYKNTKDIWGWKSYSRDNNQKLLLLMQPYFGKRRGEKATKALERLSRNKGGRNKYSCS